MTKGIGVGVPVALPQNRNIAPGLGDTRGDGFGTSKLDRIFVVRIDLTTATSDKLFQLEGNSVGVPYADQNDRLITIKFSDQASQAMPLLPGQSLNNFNFSQMYISWLAQAGGFIDLVVTRKIDSFSLLSF